MLQVFACTEQAYNYKNGHIPKLSSETSKSELLLDDFLSYILKNNLSQDFPFHILQVLFIQLVWMWSKSHT